MQIDPRLAPLGVKVVSTPNAKWSVVSALYEDETQSGGNHNIYFQVQDTTGKPMPNVQVFVDYPQDPSDPHRPIMHLTDQNGQTNEPINANLDIHLLNGPYWAYVEDPNKSDRVTGMGLPEHRHVNFRLTFAPATSGGGGAPQSLEQTAQEAAIAHKPWMPINDQGALYKFALKTNLGYPQTDEFEFTVGMDTYVGQVYNLGIVYVNKGDWANCKWVKKP
jgi:hypothetical protein